MPPKQPAPAGGASSAASEGCSPTKENELNEEARFAIAGDAEGHGEDGMIGAMLLGTKLGTLTRGWIVAGLLLVMTLITYLPALDGQLHLGRRRLCHRQPASLADRLCAASGSTGALPAVLPAHPPALWIDYQLCGLNPVGYHVVNVLLHGPAPCCSGASCVASSSPAPGSRRRSSRCTRCTSNRWRGSPSARTRCPASSTSRASAYLRFDSPGRRPRRRRKRVAKAARDLGRLRALARALLRGVPREDRDRTLPAALLLVLWWKEAAARRARDRAALPFFAIGPRSGCDRRGSSATFWARRATPAP